MKCDRCGKEIKYPVIIRHNVGIVSWVFGEKIYDYELCPECAASFRVWLAKKDNN